MSSAPVALVARATHPIGRALASILAKDGLDVAVSFEQDDETAREIAEVVEEEGQRALALPGRVGDAMVAKSIVQRTIRQLGGLDRLAVMPRSQAVSTPRASSPAQAFTSVDLGQVETVLQADLKGPWVLLQAAAEHGFEGDDASAVIVTTPASHREGIEGVASRAADEALAEVVATAGAALDPTVQVNGVRPGIVVPEDVQRGSVTADTEAQSNGPDVGQTPATPRGVACVVNHLLKAPAGMAGQVVQVGQSLGNTSSSRGEEDEVSQALAGIQRRIEPPDPEERIDLEESDGAP